MLVKLEHLTHHLGSLSMVIPRFAKGFKTIHRITDRVSNQKSVDSMFFYLSEQNSTPTIGYFLVGGFNPFEKY